MYALLYPINMKSFLSTLLFLLPLFLHAQDPELPVNANGIIEYTAVVSVDSITEQQFYSRAKLFITNAFNSATDVTKLDDPVSFTVITKGNLLRYHSNPFNQTQGGYVAFKFTVQCPVGRYK